MLWAQAQELLCVTWVPHTSPHGSAESEFTFHSPSDRGSSTGAPGESDNKQQTAVRKESSSPGKGLNSLKTGIIFL